MTDEQKEQVRYFGFAAFVGVLLLLTLSGVFRTIFGLDTAAIVTVLGGYRIFYNSIAALLEGDISADLAICIAVIAALVIGEYQAGAEAMFVMLLGDGLEGYAAGRTNAAIHRFVEQMPRRARVMRGGAEGGGDGAEVTAGDRLVGAAGGRGRAGGAGGGGDSRGTASTST